MKRIKIKYLDLDENTYIENGKIRSKLNENDYKSIFLTWDEGWERVKMIVRKVSLLKS